MARLALAILVGLLACGASGASTLVAGEPCSGIELAEQGDDDGGCPPTCVTCGCCAQAVEAHTLPGGGTPEIPLPVQIAVPLDLLNAEPRDILHVPRRGLA